MRWLANSKNLMPIETVNSRRTREKHAEDSRKAGKASGAARRKKADFRKTLNALLATEIDSPEWTPFLESQGLDSTLEAAVNAAMIKESLAGNVKAYEAIAKYTGQSSLPGMGPPEDFDEEAKIKYPLINIPDNGRNKNTSLQISPQAGPQTLFMASAADIVIYGGAAGGGKTYALLLESLRHKDVKGFGGVIFRHNYNQITAQGGLWDASHKIFDQIPDAHDKKTPKLHWYFDGGAKLNFAHIERDEDLKSWQGTEIAYIGFDELTHFTKHQFLYMLSRNRTTCGIRPYIRCTCNPDADSWVADYIAWWIDQNTGYAIPERSGKIRWMVVLSDIVYWGDTPEELAKKYEVNVEDCKSVTFIASRLEDNKVLLESDPGYMANLKAMTEVDMERLLKGNWKIKAAAGKYFKRSQIGPSNMLSQLPTDVIFWCRAWDIAATGEDEGDDPDYTAGVLIGRRRGGSFIVGDVINMLVKAGDVENLIRVTALADREKYSTNYTVRIPQDPGAAGKIVAHNYVRMLAGFNVRVMSVSGSKELRATPFAAQCPDCGICKDNRYGSLRCIGTVRPSHAGCR